MRPHRPAFHLICQVVYTPPPAAQAARPINPFLIGNGNCTTYLALCAAFTSDILSLSGTHLLATIFDRQFPCRYRPLPSHAPQDCLSRLFAAYPTILRPCHSLRHMSPSIRCHGVSIKQEGVSVSQGSQSLTDLQCWRYAGQGFGFF